MPSNDEIEKLEIAAATDPVAEAILADYNEEAGRPRIQYTVYYRFPGDIMRRGRSHRSLRAAKIRAKALSIKAQETVVINDFAVSSYTAEVAVYSAGKLVSGLLYYHPKETKKYKKAKRY